MRSASREKVAADGAGISVPLLVSSSWSYTQLAPSVVPITVPNQAESTNTVSFGRFAINNDMTAAIAQSAPATWKATSYEWRTGGLGRMGGIPQKPDSIGWYTQFISGQALQGCGRPARSIA
ncbi:hypothetical protein M2405_006354 [Rhodococcus erythropolis]|nr:hypothetical protein [Rhodococcus erythropolis]